MSESAAIAVAFILVVGGGITTGAVQLDNSPETVGSNFQSPNITVAEYGIENQQAFVNVTVDNPNPIGGEIRNLTYNIYTNNHTLANGEITNVTIDQHSESTHQISIEVTDDLSPLFQIATEDNVTIAAEVQSDIVIGGIHLGPETEVDLPSQNIPMPSGELNDYQIINNEVEFDVIVDNPLPVNITIHEISHDATWGEVEGTVDGELVSGGVTNITIGAEQSTVETITIETTDEFLSAAETNNTLWVDADVMFDGELDGIQLSDNFQVEVPIDVSHY